jgi:hypothetical protein
MEPRLTIDIDGDEEDRDRRQPSGIGQAGTKEGQKAQPLPAHEDMEADEQADGQRGQDRI